MTDRNRAVRLLLGWYLDVLPAPRSNQLAGGGEVESRKVECPDCHGEGIATMRVRGMATRHPCERCGGSIAEGRRGTGRIAVDDYTGRQVSTAELALPRPTRTTRCFQCWGAGVFGNGRRCWQCGGSGRQEVPLLDAAEADRGPGQSQQSREVALEATHSDVGSRLWSLGSFAELEQALGELQSPWRRLVWRVYVVHELTDLDLEQPDREQLGRTVTWTGRRTELLAGGEIRVPGVIVKWEAERRSGAQMQGRGRDANGYAQGIRNTEIRALHATGEWSMNALGRRFGLNKSTVCRIIGRS